MKNFHDSSDVNFQCWLWDTWRRKFCCSIFIIFLIFNEDSRFASPSTSFEVFERTQLAVDPIIYVELTMGSLMKIVGIGFSVGVASAIVVRTVRATGWLKHNEKSKLVRDAVEKKIDENQQMTEKVKKSLAQWFFLKLANKSISLLYDMLIRRYVVIETQIEKRFQRDHLQEYVTYLYQTKHCILTSDFLLLVCRINFNFW